MAARGRGRGRGYGRGAPTGHRDFDDTVNNLGANNFNQDFYNNFSDAAAVAHFQFNDAAEKKPLFGDDKDNIEQNEGLFDNLADDLMDNLFFVNIQRFQNLQYGAYQVQIIYSKLFYPIWSVATNQLGLALKFIGNFQQINYTRPYELQFKVQGHHYQTVNGGADAWEPSVGVHAYTQSLGGFAANHRFADYDQRILTAVEKVRDASIPQNINSEGYIFIIEEIVVMLAQRRHGFQRSPNDYADERRRPMAAHDPPSPVVQNFDDDMEVVDDAIDDFGVEDTLLADNARFFVGQGGDLDDVLQGLEDHADGFAGCGNHERKKMIHEHLGLWLESAKSSNNNCLFATIIAGMLKTFRNFPIKMSGGVTLQLRNYLQLEKNQLVPISEYSFKRIFKILDRAKQFPVKITVITPDCIDEPEFIYMHGEDPQREFNLFYDTEGFTSQIGGHNGAQEMPPNHIYLVHGFNMQTRWCNDCRKPYRGDDHECNALRKSFLSHQGVLEKTPKASFLRPKEINQKPIKLVVIDLETGPFDNEEHQPFATGVRRNDGSYIAFYDKGCMDEFIDDVYAYQELYEGVWVAHNGSRFDFHILLKFFCGLKVIKLIPSSLVISNGRILSAKFVIIGTKNTIFSWVDSYQHMAMSLRKLSKEYGLSLSKFYFPYFAMTSWDKVNAVLTDLKLEDYSLADRIEGKIKTVPERFDVRKETLHYLKQDVMVLAELIEKYCVEMRMAFPGVEPLRYMTLPQMGFSIFKSMISDPYAIQIVTDREMETFFRRALFGGRVTLQRYKWRSKDLDAILATATLDEEGNIKLAPGSYSRIKDFMRNLDNNSLYPAAMRRFKYPAGPYSKLEILPPTKKYREKKYIAEVTVLPNQNLAHALLPMRSPDGRLEYNLLERTECYTSVDLEFAIKHGYIVTEWHEFIYWDREAEMFSDFTDKCQTIKNDGAAEGNLAKKNCGKLINNSVYGKLMQNQFDEKVVALRDQQSYERFWDKMIWTDFIVIGDNVFLKGKPIQEKKETSSRSAKPVHEGAFVTAYARQIMFEAIQLIDPTFTNPDCVYYFDTDSIHGHCDDLAKMEPLFGDALGQFKDDMGKGAKIVQFIGLGKKYYTESAVLPNDTLVNNFHCKGIPKHLLSLEAFEKAAASADYTEEFVFDSMESTAMKPLKNQKAFSHYNIQMKRRFNLTEHIDGVRHDDGTYRIIKENTVF